MVSWKTDSDETIDSYIVEQSKTGKTVRTISEELGVSHVTILNRVKAHKLEVYFKKRVNDWKKIAKRIAEIDIPFYQSQDLFPLEERREYYRLVEFKVITKTKGNYRMLCHVTSEMRRGWTSDWSKPSRYGRLPVDCFIDEHSPTLLGNTDMYNSPRQPMPKSEPDDWEEFLQNKIDSHQYMYNSLKDYSIIDQYDGTCSSGYKGKDPGKWYMQPKYVEIWVESANSQKTVDKLKGDNNVHVAAFGGIGSTTRLYNNCMRLKQIKENNKHIKKVVILYCGDLDSTGDWLDEYIINAIVHYAKFKHGVDFEFKRVAVLPKQIEEFDLVEDPEYVPPDKRDKDYASEKNKDPRFKRFKEKYPKLIAKYGEKFGIQLEAMFTTQYKITQFEKLLDNAIKQEFSEDIYKENCPPKEYDYEANGEEEPQDIDIDSDYPDNPEKYEERNMTIREVMQYRIDQHLSTLQDDDKEDPQN